MPGHYRHRHSDVEKMTNTLLSQKNRVLAHARNTLIQRELRRNITRALRQAEREHVHGAMSRVGENDQNLEALRREMLLSGLR